jgi:ATP-dependent Clp protease protease subunit
MRFDELLGIGATFIHAGPIEESSAASIATWLGNNRKQPKMTLVFMTFGGSVHYALAIYDAIKLMAATTEIHIVALGTCQSAGTIIISAVAPERRHTAPNTRFMIHALTTTKDDMSLTCEPRAPRPEVLREISQQLGCDLAESYRLQDILVEILRQSTRLGEVQIREMLKADTFFSAERALEYGLVGHILTAEPKPSSGTKARRWYYLWLR